MSAEIAACSGNCQGINWKRSSTLARRQHSGAELIEAWNSIRKLKTSWSFQGNPKGTGLQVRPGCQMRIPSASRARTSEMIEMSEFSRPREKRSSCCDGPMARPDGAKPRHHTRCPAFRLSAQRRRGGSLPRQSWSGNSRCSRRSSKSFSRRQRKPSSDLQSKDKPTSRRR